MSDKSDKVRIALIELGVVGLEGRVYLHLLGGQAETVVNIARVLGAKRTSVYDALSKLSEKRLTVKVLKGNGSRYRAVGLDRLTEMVQEEEDKLAKMNKAMEVLKAHAMTAKLASQAGTQVRYYEGVEGMRQMIWNCLKADRQGIVGYSVFGRVEVVGRKFYGRFVEEFARRNLSDRVIVNPRPRTLAVIKSDVQPNTHQLTNQNIRMLPEERLYIAGDTMIYNQTYAVSYWQEGEVVGVEIESPEFVKSQLSIFEILWEMAVRLEE